MDPSSTRGSHLDSPRRTPPIDVLARRRAATSDENVRPVHLSIRLQRTDTTSQSCDYWRSVPRNRRARSRFICIMPASPPVAGACCSRRWSSGCLGPVGSHRRRKEVAAWCRSMRDQSDRYPLLFTRLNVRVLWSYRHGSRYVKHSGTRERATWYTTGGVKLITFQFIDSHSAPAWRTPVLSCAEPRLGQSPTIEYIIDRLRFTCTAQH